MPKPANGTRQVTYYIHDDHDVKKKMVEIAPAIGAIHACAVISMRVLALEFETMRICRRCHTYLVARFQYNLHYSRLWQPHGHSDRRQGAVPL